MIELREQYRNSKRNLDDVRHQLESCFARKIANQKYDLKMVNAIKRKYPDLYNEVEKWTLHE